MTILLLLCAIPASAQEARAIAADMHATAGPRDMAWQFCVGAGHAALLLNPANLAQLKQVHRDIGFRYVRFHGILSDEMGVYNVVNGAPFYDFSKVDALYGSILGAGMRPFVELSFMPSALASGDQTVFDWKTNVTPPADLSKWEGLIGAFASHLVSRFGYSEVEHWRFEVWNEPNLAGFWQGADQDAYFRLYDATAVALKSVDASLPVGGPASAGTGWIDDFIAHLDAAHMPADFISTHTYGSYGGFMDDQGQADVKLIPGPDAIAADVKRVRDQVAASKRPELPVDFTEWNSSYSQRDPMHDSYFSAAYILDKIKRSEGMAEALSYWTYSDLFEEEGPPPAAFYGGFGLITRDGIEKPAYFAYKYLNALGPMLLADADPQSWLTADAAGDFTALIWDFSQPAQESSDRPFFSKDHPSEALPAVALTVNSLAPGKYVFTIHRTGYRHNDAYSQVIAWANPKDLAPDQIATLRQQTNDAPETATTVSVDSSGTFSASIPMNTNDVVLVALTRVR